MMLPVLYSSPEVEVTEIILQKSETFVSWLDTKADLSQILDFLVHRASLWLSFPQLRRGWVQLVYLSVFVYTYLKLCFFTLFF